MPRALNWYDPYKDDDEYYSGDEDKEGFLLALNNAGIVRRKLRKTKKPEVHVGPRGGLYVMTKGGKKRSILDTKNSIPTNKANIYGRRIYASKSGKEFVFNSSGTIPITKFSTIYIPKPPTMYKVINNRSYPPTLVGPRGGLIRANISTTREYVRKNLLPNYIERIARIKPTNVETNMVNWAGRQVYKNKKGRLFVITPYKQRKKFIKNFNLVRNTPTGNFTKSGKPIIKTRKGSLKYNKTYIYTPDMFKNAGQTPTGKKLYTSGYGNLFYIGKTGRKHHIYQNIHLNTATQFKNASGRTVYKNRNTGKTFVLTKHGKRTNSWRFPKNLTSKLPANVIRKITGLNV